MQKSGLEIINLDMNNSINKNKSNRNFSIILFILILTGLAACQKDDQDPQGLLSIDLMSVDFITQSSATFTADIFGDLELVDSMGFCWGSNNRPTLDQDYVKTAIEIGIYSSQISGFSPGSKYFGRAFYAVDGEIYYSNTIQFEIPRTVADNRGNEYPTVKIGRQLWMAENLLTTTYNNGETIRDGTGLGNYSLMQQPKLYFNYGDDTTYLNDYGRLYTWYVIADERGVCPAGWRVPDIIDWQKLSTHLDALTIALSQLGEGQKEMSAVSGGMMKTKGSIENGTGLWYTPNNAASNVSNLGVVPGGFRDPSGAFDGLGYNAAFWSLTANDNINAQMFYMHFFNGGFFTNSFSKYTGYAVRCMRDSN
jgi:uncharacterized protein (TIGR02145 family)